MRMRIYWEMFEFMKKALLFFFLVISFCIIAAATPVFSEGVVILKQSTSIKLHTRIASNGSGYLCIWDEQGVTGDKEIFGQFLSQNGSQAGENINISHSPSEQTSPDIDTDHKDNYMVVWADKRGALEPGHSGYDIYGAILTAQGIIVKEIIIENGIGDQKLPMVKWNGVHYLVVWEDWRVHNIETNKVLLSGKRIDPNGEIIDIQAFEIDSASAFNKQGLKACYDIASVEDPNFPLWFIAWNGLAQNQTGSSIVGRIITEDEGIYTQSPAFSIQSPSHYPFLMNPGIESLHKKFLVAWEGWTDKNGTDSDIQGIIVDVHGTPINNVITISSALNKQRFPDVTQNGKVFFILWSDQRDSRSTARSEYVYGTIMTADGFLLHDPNQIANEQPATRISKDPNQIVWLPSAVSSITDQNDFFCLWSSSEVSRWSILGRLYTPPPTMELIWPDTTEYENDGINPDSGHGGDSFVFKITCIMPDGNGAFPQSAQVWIDLDDNGYYGKEERLTMGYEGEDPHNLSARVFSSTVHNVLYDGDGILRYRFFFLDSTNNPALGEPAFDRTFTVLKNGNQPQVDWTGAVGFTGDGTRPDGAEWGKETSFEFQIMYKDGDGDQPQNTLLLVDEDGDGEFNENEQWIMEADGGSPITGQLYKKTLTLRMQNPGIMTYKVDFDDGKNKATGEPRSGSYLSFNPIGETTACLNNKNQFSPSILSTGKGYQIFWEEQTLNESGWNTMPDAGHHIWMELLSKKGTVLDRSGERGQIRIDTSTIGALKPKACFDPAGQRSLVVWEDMRNGYTLGTPDIENSFKPESPYRGFDIFGLFIDQNGIPLPLSTNPTPSGEFLITDTDTTYNMLNPDLCIGSEGKCLVVWEDEKMLHTSGKTDIYSSFIRYPEGIYGGKIDLLGVDDSSSISEGHQLMPEVASNGIYYMVIWQSVSSASINTGFVNSRIYGMRVDPNGRVYPKGIGFKLYNELTMDDPNLNQLFPDIASDGENFLVVWQDSRSITTKRGFDIYGMRINEKGEYLDLPFKEIPICTVEGNQIRPRVYWDSQGRHYIIEWLQVSDTISQSDILLSQMSSIPPMTGSINVVRMDPNGKLIDGPQDTPETYPGTHLVGIADTQDHSDMCCDPNFGCRLVWEDIRNHSSYDLYSVSFNAVLNWPEDPNYAQGISPSIAPTGNDFIFNVVFRDRLDISPLISQVWIDINDNGLFEEDEKFTMQAHTPSPPVSSGILYTYTKKIFFPKTIGSDGIIMYRFYFETPQGIVNGIASGIYSFTVYGPMLYWTGEPGFDSDGVEPDDEKSGSEFLFDVVYKDTSAIKELKTAQVWIDQDDNGKFDPLEMYDMPEKDSHDKDFSDGKEYLFSIPLFFHGDGIITYTFFFHNGSMDAKGEPSEEQTLTITRTLMDEMWQIYTKEDGLGGNYSTALAVDQNNVLWAGLFSGSEDPNIGGLSKFDETLWHTFKGNGYLPNNYVTTLTISKDNHLWVGTASGISHFNGQSWEQFMDIDTNRHITSITSDDYGRVWAGIYPAQDPNTYEIAGGGLAKYDSGHWYIYNREIMGGNLITAISIDRDGLVWTGIVDNYLDANGRVRTIYKGIAVFDPVNEKVVGHFNTSEGNYSGGDFINAIYRDDQGNMWIGSIDVSGDVQKGAGLSCYHPSHGDWLHFRNGENNVALASNIITSIGGKKEELWVGHYPDETGMGGATYHNLLHDTWMVYNSSNVPIGKAFNYINTLTMDKNDNVWFGTINGLTGYVPKQILTLSEGWNLISFQATKCFYEGALPSLSIIETDSLEQINFEKKASLLAWLLDNTHSPIRDAADPNQTGNWQRITSFDHTGAHLIDKKLPPFINTLHYLSFGYGYWIKMNKPGLFIVNGRPAPPSFSLSLKEGWNLMGEIPSNICYGRRDKLQHTICPYKNGVYKEEEAILYCPMNSLASTVLISIGGKYRRLTSFDSCNGAMLYDTNLPPFINTLQYIGPKYGYWIKMLEDGTLTPLEGCPQ